MRSTPPLKVGTKQAPLAPDAPLHVHFSANSVTVAPRSLAKLAEKCTMFGNRLHRQLVYCISSPGGSANRRACTAVCIAIRRQTGMSNEATLKAARKCEFR